jgi:radical SAM superfamily enzyme YgiQ (UPF0313 family)
MFMKILLVQSYLGRKENIPIYPLGLTYIATALHNNGHTVKIYDPNVVANPYENLREIIVDFSPDIVGISLRNIDNQLRTEMFYYYKHFQKILKAVKELIPNAKILVGGTGFSMFAKKIMERNLLIDYGIYLEAEDSLPELLDNPNAPWTVKGIFFRKEGQVLFSGMRPLPNFKNLPIPKREFSDITPYLSNTPSLGIQSKRGCPLKCTYCNYPFLNGNNLRIRDANDVCDEIEYLVKQFGVKHFMFADAVFNMPLNHASEICEEIIRRQLDIKWVAYMDIKHASKDFLLLAAKAGCVDVIFSPDGISQSALDGLNKGLREKDIKDSLRLFLTDRNLRDINVVYSIFINPPGETFVGLLKTIAFFLKTKLYLRGRGNGSINWIRLEPDTRALDVAIEEGAVDKDIELLPEDTQGLSKVFYSKRSLRHLDFFLIMMLKSIPLLKRILLKFGIPIKRHRESDIS